MLSLRHFAVHKCLLGQPLKKCVPLCTYNAVENNRRLENVVFFLGCLSACMTTSLREIHKEGVDILEKQDIHNQKHKIDSQKTKRTYV